MGVLSQSLLFEEKGIIHKRVQVIQDGHLRYLRFGENGGWQGALHMKTPSRIIFPYQRALAALVSSLPAIDSFFSFGVGTGTALRTVQSIHPKCRLFGVDIEQSVIEAAITYFSAPSYEEATYFVGDGIQFLSSQTILFDLIFVDAYLKDGIYSPVLDPAFLANLGYHLTKTGTVVFNIIGRFTGSLTSIPFYRTLHDLFGHVVIQPVGLPFTEQNALVGASRIHEFYYSWRRETWKSPWLRKKERFVQPFRFRLL
jgi:spermidine synthase